jgi:hypothetical protein
MKTLLTALLFLLFGSLCSAQELKLDSTWTVNEHNFRFTLEQNEESNPPLNTKLSLSRKDEILLIDSLWCSRLYIELQDMNDDGFEDLLVYQGSGARANETYNLFLFRKEKNDFQKVQGYEEWPNLHKTEIKGILAATILTGTVEYRFFEFDSSGALRDLGISVEDYSYEGQGYKKGLKQVKKKLKQ